MGKGKRKIGKRKRERERLWVATGDYRQPVTVEQVEQAWEFFSECYHDEEVLILSDSDPRLKDYKDFTTMDLE